jgi:hypothetical protein
MVFRRLPQAFAAASGGLLASQFPAFYDQYLQSLGGRLDQARIHAARIAEVARDQGMHLEAYIRRFADNADPVVRSQAEVMASTVADEARLSAAFAVLSEAPAGLRPVVFLRHLDLDIAAATADRFTPAAPLGLEGLSYLAVGALLGLAALAGGRVLARKLRRRLARGQDRLEPSESEHAG